MAAPTTKDHTLTNDIPQFKFAVREELKTSGVNFIPRKGEPAATGYDVRAAIDPHNKLVIKPFEYFKIPLGIRCLPPEGWWFQLHPRSSSFVKRYMHCLIGIIDEHYADELIFAGQYLPGDSLREAGDITVAFGDSIGQIVPVKRVEIDCLDVDNTEFDRLCGIRNAVRVGGFGSTGK